MLGANLASSRAISSTCYPGAQVLGRAAGIGGTGTGGFADHLRQQVIRQARLCQYRVGKPLVLSHQAQQQMFFPHIAVTQFASGFLGQLQAFPQWENLLSSIMLSPLFLIVK